jgi:hypothetical protein
MGASSSRWARTTSCSPTRAASTAGSALGSSAATLRRIAGRADRAATRSWRPWREGPPGCVGISPVLLVRLPPGRGRLPPPAPRGDGSGVGRHASAVGPGPPRTLVAGLGRRPSCPAVRTQRVPPAGRRRTTRPDDRPGAGRDGCRPLRPHGARLESHRDHGTGRPGGRPRANRRPAPQAPAAGDELLRPQPDRPDHGPAHERRRLAARAPRQRGRAVALRPRPGGGDRRADDLAQVATRPGLLRRDPALRAQLQGLRRPDPSPLARDPRPGRGDLRPPGRAGLGRAGRPLVRQGRRRAGRPRLADRRAPVAGLVEPEGRRRPGPRRR